MSVVHIQTTIQTILGVVDDQGNVVQKVPVNLEVQKLEEQLFRDAALHILSAKEQLVESEAGVKEPKKTGKATKENVEKNEKGK